MSLEQDYYNIGKWVGDKLHYHKISYYNSIKRKQVLQGEIWECDLGYNIGEEKNKKRPVLVVSNNFINRTGKVIVACITDAKGKIKPSSHVPYYDSWHLLYSNTTDDNKMFRPGRTIPKKAISYSFLDKDSVVQCEELRFVSKARLSANKCGSIDPRDFTKIQDKLKNVFDIP